MEEKVIEQLKDALSFLRDAAHDIYIDTGTQTEDGRLTKELGTIVQSGTEAIMIMAEWMKGVASEHHS